MKPMNLTRTAKSLLFLCGACLGLARADEALTPESAPGIYERVAPAIAVVNYSVEVTNDATGETTKRDTNCVGVVVAPDGLIMAHGHMALPNAQPFNLVATVGTAPNEKKYPAILLEKPEDVNVVFLRLKSDTPLNLPCLRFDRPESLKLGSAVAIAGVMGETFDFARCLHEERIAAVLDKPRHTYTIQDPIRFGFIGGPVIDAAGRVVGVLGFDLSRDEGGDIYVRSGHPLIFQASLFQKYIDTPPSENKGESGSEDAWLGVLTQPLTEEFARYWKLEQTNGIIVSTVVENSPAASIGLQAGDIVTEFNGTPIVAKTDRDVMGFTKVIRDSGVDKEVGLKVLRGGQALDLKVKLGTRPRMAAEATEYEDPVFGITVREITTDLRLRVNLPESVEGIIVRKVESGSAAQLGKMRPGVIIMGINGQSVRSIEEYKAAVAKAASEKPKEVAIFARVGAATGFFRLEPRWDDANK